MKCEYGDGFKVDYSGSLRITKGEDVNVYVNESFIPFSAKSGLDAAAMHNSCSELRKAAQGATTSLHDAWYKE
jgi:hypothetical protein